MIKEKVEIEKIIEENGFYVTAPKGTSMLPLIYQGHDTVIIKPKGRRLDKYDVALYKRKNGEYVLHRVIYVKKDSYVFCGDNQTVLEYGVTDDMILGVMTELIHDGDTVDTASKEYYDTVKKRVKKAKISRIKGKIKGFIKKCLGK